MRPIDHTRNTAFNRGLEIYVDAKRKANDATLSSTERRVWTGIATKAGNFVRRSLFDTNSTDGAHSAFGPNRINVDEKIIK